MTSRWLSTVPLFLLLALSVYFALGLTQDPRTIQSVLIDKPLPAFDLPAFGRDGERLTSADLKGQVSLVNVFASWCVACRAEHPLLLKLTAAKRVAIYGIAWKDNPTDLKQWLAELGDPYTRIGEDATGRTAIDLGVTGAPETFLVDRTGRIRFKQIGPIDEETWTKTLEPMIAKIEAEK